MKKVIYLVSITLLLVAGAMAQTSAKNFGRMFVLPVAGNAAPEAVVTAAAPTINVETGTNFTVPVTVSDTTGQGIIAYQFDLHYDPAVIQLQTNPVEVAGTISGGLIAVFNPITPGILKVAVYGAYPLTGAGTLINFKFTAVGPPAAASPLTWVNFMFNEGTPGANAMNGQVKLVSSSSGSGPVPSNFSGQETVGGTKDLLNNIYRNNTFVMISNDPADPANAGSLTVSLDMAPIDGLPGAYNIVSGNWSLTVFREGNYVGSLYGEISRGRVTDTLNNLTGETLQRKIKARIRIKGGIGSYENIRPQETNNADFTLSADYLNGRRASASMAGF